LQLLILNNNNLKPLIIPLFFISKCTAVEQELRNRQMFLLFSGKIFQYNSIKPRNNIFNILSKLTQ